MGQIVGAAVVSHVPPIVMSEEYRRSTNDGEDISLVPGLHRLRSERLDEVHADTFIVIDTHWFTTFEHVVSAHDHRSGLYTSDELPRGMAAHPYDLIGDPELADLIAAVAEERDDTWVHATRDPHIAIHYPTVNLLPFLQCEERWVGVGVCQTATCEDFLILGEVIAEAVRRSKRRVVILGSGGLSHRFWPLQHLRQHEDVHPRNIVTAAARAADELLLERMQRGDHAAIIDGYDEFRQHSPEGRFGHYLIMVGALGGRECQLTGTMYSNYEASAGTGQAHVWFDVADVT
jgi:3,4-dihydroxyphenylacetate 2,3-dioxygenase